MKLIHVSTLFFITKVLCLHKYDYIDEIFLVRGPGRPLFLTPLIETGNIEKARNLSKVQLSGAEEIRSYSGYLTVNKQFSSNLFFWFFPAQSNFKDAPVILWLQGGPGASSMVGLFIENGPFFLEKTGNLKLREYSWTQSHNVIYIDNPVGTGYSFTHGGYAQNQTAVGNDLYNALLQFFKLFPELQKNPFFAAGESYAGKYVPSVSYTIHKNNPTASQKINLQGLLIGDGISDPEHQSIYSDYLFHLGLIDSNARDIFKAREQKGIKYIQSKRWLDATNLFMELVHGDMSGRKSLFKNITGFDSYLNYLVAKDTNHSIDHMAEYIQRQDIRKSIHVGNIPFHCFSMEVVKQLLSDVMQSVAPWISELLSHYRILIYNGQLDILVPYPLTVNYLQNLDFNGAKDYKRAKRHQWYVESDLAGYVKQAGNLTEVLVRNAGHMVPVDQPKWALDLISRFVRNQKFPDTPTYYNKNYFM